MPSTTTFRTAVNDVLASVGLNELSAPLFASATQHQRRVKKIVATLVAQMRANLPDEHWQAIYELTLLPPRTTGLVTAINNSAVDFSGSGATDAAWSPYDLERCLFQVEGENEWHWVWKGNSTSQIQLRINHPLAPVTYPAGKAYRIAQIGYKIPSRVRDLENLFQPFVGQDVEPCGVDELIRDYFASSALVTGDPRKYAIGSDITPGGTYVSTTEIVSPILYAAPLPPAARVYTMLYQRRPIAIDENSAENVALDIPEDLVEQMKFRGKMIASVEVANKGNPVELYSALAQEQRKGSLERQQTGATQQFIVPADSYNSYFSRGRRRGRGRRIIVDGE
jgi:hypothetical protein